jgi:hypothetical protein
MTSVNVTYRPNGTVREIYVSGHSNYGEAGTDIVCSAVSTAMYVSLGLIEKTGSKHSFKVDNEKASMRLVIDETNDFTEIIMVNLVSTLSGISKDYAKYLQIKYTK